MTSLFRPSPCFAWKKAAGIVVGVCLLIFGLMAITVPLLAADAPPPSGASPAPISKGPEDFGKYLVDHQSDLAPFFSKYNDQLGQEGLPLLFALMGTVAFWTLVAGWAIDVLLSRCFSAYFAPIYAKLKRAFLYASGRLILSLVCTVLSGFLLMFAFNMPNLAVVFLVLIGLLSLATLAAQVWWVYYLYRMGLIPSVVFYLSLIAVHSVIVLFVSAPVLGKQAPQYWIGFMNQNVTSKLQTEIDAAKHELADAAKARDDVKNQVTDAQNRIAKAASDQQELQKEIEDKKNSETYLFSQIAKARAKGDLAAAHDQLKAFIAKFPSGSLIDTARTELTGLENDMATQEAQRKQAEADAAKAAAVARADLLDRASKGQVTLSEMRQALIGKTLAQVTDLLGQPAEVASNRWGYSQQMIVNPLTEQKFGLAVNFSNETVQGVDYYYGRGAK